MNKTSQGIRFTFDRGTNCDAIARRANHLRDSSIKLGVCWVRGSARASADLPIVSACSFLQGSSREGIDPDPAIRSVAYHSTVNSMVALARNATRRASPRTASDTHGDTLPRPRLTRDPLEPYLIKPIPAPTQGSARADAEGREAWRSERVNSIYTRRFRAIVSSILIIVIARRGMDGGAVAMKTIGEGLLGEYRRAKSDVQRSNGNSAAIYARLGTMHHASGCCRYAAGSRTLHSQCTPGCSAV